MDKEEENKHTEKPHVNQETVDAIAEGQAALYKREKYKPLAGIIPVVVQLIILLGLVDVIRRLLASGNPDDIMFFGLNLGWVPSEQGGLTLLAGAVRPLMTEQALACLSLVGSVLIFCVGLNLVWGKKVRVANMLPAVLFAVLAAYLPWTF